MSGTLPVGYKSLDLMLKESPLGVLLQEEINKAPQVASAAGEAAALAAIGAAVPHLPVGVPTELTAESHGARWLILTDGGHQLSVDWNDTGAGFSCTITNLTSYGCRPALTGFTDALIRGSDLGIRPGGTAVIFLVETGGERLAFLTGDTA